MWMFKVLTGCAFLVLLIFILNCSDSALSDVKLTDPSVIIFQADMKRVRTVSGYFSQSIEVNLKDKNGNYVELKGGRILVNDREMDVEHYFGGGPYYVMTSNLVTAGVDSLYTFTMVMADSSTYESNIHTQSKDLQFLNIPVSHPKSDSLKISFGLMDSISTRNLYITKHLKGDSSSDLIIHSTYETYPISRKDTVSMAFTPAYFEPNLEQMDIKVTSEKSGTANPALRKGSYVRCIMEISGSFATVPWTSIKN